MDAAHARRVLLDDRNQAEVTMCLNAMRILFPEQLDLLAKMTNEWLAAVEKARAMPRRPR